MPPSRARATLFIALSAIFFSALGPFTVTATNAGAPLPTILAGRYLVAALLLFAIARNDARIPTVRATQLTLAGGFGQAVIAFSALSSLRWINVATMVFLFYTYPAWVALLAIARGSERLDARHVIALILSLAGVAFMVGSPWSGPIAWQGVALALIAAVGFALYIPLIETLQRDVTPPTASAFVAVGAALSFIVLGLVTRQLTLQLAPAAIGSILGLAVVCTTIGFILFLKGLAVLGPVRTAIISTVEPFSAAILSWAVLGQALRAPTLVGGVMIALAVILLLTAPKLEPIPKGSRDRGGPLIS